jgi:NodT family efflux transporter outer membrane factor (OMF) lipoprotein
VKIDDHLDEEESDTGSGKVFIEVDAADRIGAHRELPIRYRADHDHLHLGRRQLHRVRIRRRPVISVSGGAPGIIGRLRQQKHPGKQCQSQGARPGQPHSQPAAPTAQGFFFPTVAAGYQFERQKLAGNLSGSSAPGVQGNGQSITAVQNPTGTPHNEPLYFNFQTAQLTVGFVPDVFGANRRQVESLAAQQEGQRLALEATYVTLASNMVAAAIQEASLRAQLAAVHEIIGINEKSLEILRAQFKLGYAMRIDVAAQEAALAQAKALLPPLQKQFEQTRDLIRALAGNLPNEEVAETFELDSLQLPRELPVSLPAKIIEQRPDVLEAQAQLHAANAQVGVAVAALLPQFSITAADGGAATQFAWLFRSGGPFWNVIGGVSQPIFDGGTLWHRKRARG